MHNFSGYDSHLILPSLSKSKIPRIKNISVIPRTGEKFLSIRINNRITFLDSRNFLAGSLDSLFKTIVNRCKFSLIKQSSLISYTNTSGEKVLSENHKERLKCLKRKGNFPYDYAQSLEDYSLPCLPSKKAFYNSLTRQELPDEEYEFAKEVWNIFRMNTMQEYMETYCLGDTLLLAEVFETFRNESIENFEIEPCHFVSLPGFAYQAFLKTTKVKLEYITDPKFLELLQNNLRGGHSFSSQRYEESSSFKSSIDPAITSNDELRQHILYIDANNLYGCAQKYNLPTGKFRYLSDEEKMCIDWENIDLCSDTGYFVQCDLEYPPEIWEKQNHSHCALTTFISRLIYYHPSKENA